MLICYIRACVKGTLHPPGPSRIWSHRSAHRHFWQESLSEFGWQSNHSDGANAIKDYGRTQHTNVCIDFSLLPSGCSHKMVKSCSQYCFLSLLASQLQNQILKQTNKETRLYSFPSTDWSQVSKRQFLPEKYSYFSRASLGFLNTESTHRGIRQRREGRVLCLRFSSPTLCQNWELTCLKSFCLFNLMIQMNT